MKFQRLLSKPHSSHISDQIKWKICNSQVSAADGTIIFEMQNIEVPESWSQNATNIIAQKYFRKAGIGKDFKKVYEESIPKWLQKSKILDKDDSIFGPETSAKQVFHRIAGTWTYWGWKEGIFDLHGKDHADSFGVRDIVTNHQGFENVERNAQIFYDEIYMILAMQYAAPNSPQFFNTGLNWAYGIEGNPAGQWAFDRNGTIFETKNSYERPQVHACYIQPISDNLINENGIFDLVKKEARLFKFGSGTGTNFSNLRSKYETLSGGGKSSGLMSFLKIFDAAAGAVQSGGVTRRAAKMITLDLDHPEIEDFVEWKMKEEAKAAALFIGSHVLKNDRGSVDFKDLIPNAMLDRFANNIEQEICDLGFEGEAMNTVSGQNANNSPRITQKFLDAVDKDEDWHLISRTDGEIIKTIKARNLWNKICRAAWACADPGLQFHNTINEWHTCKSDGQIVASNPCSEYMFLDNTACNLASLNLVRFRDNHGINNKLLQHVTRLMTVVLEISVYMASFPSKEIAENSFKYRTLGLGYANLGGLFMREAIPYDSDEARSLASFITAFLHGISLQTSAEMAEELGPFSRFEANKVSMLQVISMHKEAAEKLNNKELNYIYKDLYRESFRNAQVTLIAPTGTISFVMDCDCFGIEPDFSLVKYKHLAGGGMMKIVNESVPEALENLGYTQAQIFSIVQHISENDTIEGWTLNNKEMSEDHLKVFDCAVAPRNGKRFLRPEAHILMMAAVQPFLSGAISKTVNMPRESTIADVDRIFRLANELKLKAIAIYRDGSKLTQPLNTEIEKPILQANQKPKSESKILTDLKGALAHIKGDETAAKVTTYNTIHRNRLPMKSKGYTQKVRIDGQSVYLHTSEYEDGNLGAIFLELSREGSTVRALINAIGIAVSIGLQHNVPLTKFVEAFVYRKFEPAGIVQGHENIKLCTSILDYIFRDLAIHYLHQMEYANTDVKLELEAERPIDYEQEALTENLEQETSIPVTITNHPPKSSSNTGMICPVCKHTTLIQAGTCVECSTCGFNTGCG